MDLTTMTATVGRPSDDDSLAVRMRHYDEFADAMDDALDLALKSEEYYHGDQLTSEEVTRLRKRGQPPVVFNHVNRALNYLLGSEISNRVDPQAYPRTMAHDQDAEAVTDALRYVADRKEVNLDKLRSRVVRDVLRAGWSGAVTGIQLEPDGVDEQGRPKFGVGITVKHGSWRQVYFDPRSADDDFGDARYMGISVWRDRSDLERDPDYTKAAEAYGLDLMEVLEGSAGKTGNTPTSEAHEDRPTTAWYDSDRDRVRVSEEYWWEWLQREDGSWHKCWYYAHFCSGGYLIPPTKVPYVDEHGDNWCPMVLCSAYCDTENQRYGVVKSLIDPQDEYNKRRSKALHQSVAKNVIAEEGVFTTNPQEFMTNLGKPDGISLVRDGALSEQKLQIVEQNEASNTQLQLMTQAVNEIDQYGAQAAMANARGGEKVSGRLFLAQQHAGSLEVAPVFENVKQFVISLYERLWYLIRQYWQTERWFRVRDDKSKTGYKWVGLNRRMTAAQRFQELTKPPNGMEPQDAIKVAAGEDGAQLFAQLQQAAAQQAQIAAQQGVQIDPARVQQMVMQQFLGSQLMQQPVDANSVAQLEVDIVLDTVPDTPIAQHEQFGELMALLQSNPNLAAKFPPEAVIKMSSMRNKDEIIAMMNPQQDPQAAQMQQAQMQQQMQMMQTQIAALQAKVMKDQAAAAKDQASIAGIQAKAEHDKAAALKLAAEAGLAVVPDVDIPQAANGAAQPGGFPQ